MGVHYGSLGHISHKYSAIRNVSRLLINQRTPIVNYFVMVTCGNGAVIKHGSCIRPERKQSMGVYSLSGQSRKHNRLHEAAMLVNGSPQEQKQHVHQHLAVYFLTDNLINYSAPCSGDTLETLCVCMCVQHAHST